MRNQKIRAIISSEVPIWGIVNQKGGVGKTTTAVNVSAGLAERGLRVLLVDCDPQGNATSGVGVEKAIAKTTLLDLFEAAVADEEPPTQEAILNVAPNLDLIPANLDLAGAEPMLLGAVGKEMILKDVLDPLKGQYDWIFLDAPPSLGILTINILAASEGILVPMQCEFYALEGLSQLMRTVDLVRKRINPNLQIAKVLLTMYDNRNKLTHQVEEDVRQFFGDRLSTVTIPRNVRLSEAPGFGQSAMALFPTSKGAEAYRQFVEEVAATCAAR